MKAARSEIFLSTTLMEKSCSGTWWITLRSNTLPAVRSRVQERSRPAFLPAGPCLGGVGRPVKETPDAQTCGPPITMPAARCTSCPRLAPTAVGSRLRQGARCPNLASAQGGRSATPGCGHLDREAVAGQPFRDQPAILRVGFRSAPRPGVAVLPVEANHPAIAGLVVTVLGNIRRTTGRTGHGWRTPNRPRLGALRTVRRILGGVRSALRRAGTQNSVRQRAFGRVGATGLEPVTPSVSCS